MIPRNDSDSSEGGNENNWKSIQNGKKYSVAPF